MKRILLFVLCAMLMGCSAVISNEETVKEIMAKEGLIIYPFSAEYRNVVYQRDRRSWCGELNVKNGLSGAYSGWVRFFLIHIDVGETIVTLEDDGFTEAEKMAFDLNYKSRGCE